MDEYDQSARYTIAHGQCFVYQQGRRRGRRVGYFDEATELFTVLDSAEQRSITHLRPNDPAYPWTLTGST